MELKLKPCPFCGGKGRVRSFKKGYRIVCEECGASSHYVFIQPWHDNKFVAQCQAAKAWNLRNGEKYDVNIDDAIMVLEKLKSNDGSQMVLMETPKGTLSLKLEDALIYEGCRHEIVIDSE